MDSLSNASRYRERAEGLRRIAFGFVDEELRRALVETANEYDEMARRFEQGPLPEDCIESSGEN